MSSVRPALFGALVLLAGCANELELAPGEAAVAPRPTVEVRTRPVCGNGAVEPGEDCDDGANGEDADGCDDRCQTPCEAGEAAVVSCAPGRTFTYTRRELSESLGRWVEDTGERVTLRCSLEGAASDELSVCNKGVCINVITPEPGKRICARPCARSADCAEGQACLTRVEPGSDPPELADRGRCMPVIGGTLGDTCQSRDQCGSGMSCNLIAGLDDFAICAPDPDDCEGADPCPDGFTCSTSIDTLTQDPSGFSCFASLGLPDGTRVSGDLAKGCAHSFVVPVEFVGDACERGCAKVYDQCDLVITLADGRHLTRSQCVRNCREAVQEPRYLCMAQRSCGNLDPCFGPITFGEEAYCSRLCGADRDCATGFYCSGSYGDPPQQHCTVESQGRLTAPPEPELHPTRAFPSPACADDVDTTCSFESDCDPDCRSTTGCGEVPGAGLCDGPRVLYCQENRVVSIDCAARGLGCGFDAELARYDCLRAR